MNQSGIQIVTVWCLAKYSNHLNTEPLTTKFIWILDCMGVWYSNGKVMWLGGPFKYQIFWIMNRLFQSSFQTTIQIPDHLTTKYKSTIWILDLSSIQMVTALTFVSRHFLPLFDCPIEKMFVTLNSLTSDQLFHLSKNVEFFGSFRKLELDRILSGFEIWAASSLFFPETETNQVQDSMDLIKNKFENLLFGFYSSCTDLQLQWESEYSGGSNTKHVRISDGSQLFGSSPNHSKLEHSK